MTTNTLSFVLTTIFVALFVKICQGFRLGSKLKIPYSATLYTAVTISMVSGLIIFMLLGAIQYLTKHANYQSVDITNINVVGY